MGGGIAPAFVPAHHLEVWGLTFSALERAEMGMQRGPYSPRACGRCALEACALDPRLLRARGRGIPLLSLGAQPRSPSSWFFRGVLQRASTSKTLAAQLRRAFWCMG